MVVMRNTALALTPLATAVLFLVLVPQSTSLKVRTTPGQPNSIPPQQIHLTLTGVAGEMAIDWVQSAKTAVALMSEVCHAIRACVWI